MMDKAIKSANVTIRMEVTAHGPTGTANKLHNEFRAALMALGYTLDGAMSVLIEPQWRALAEIPCGVDVVYDNQGRKWEREGNDWVTHGAFNQRLSRAVTDLSGWGPFTEDLT